MDRKCMYFRTTGNACISGGQCLKVLKNGDFLILSFLSLYEGVWGRLSPDISTREATISFRNQPSSPI